MFKDIFNKLEKANKIFLDNSETSDYAYFINHSLIIQAHQKIINYISGKIAIENFNNTFETKQYFKNIYKELYHYENNSGPVNIMNTIKILKWYYGETRDYKDLKKLIRNLYDARNKISHTNQLYFKKFGHFNESKKTLEEIDELIKKIIN